MAYLVTIDIGNDQVCGLCAVIELKDLDLGASLLYDLVVDDLGAKGCFAYKGERVLCDIRCEACGDGVADKALDAGFIFLPVAGFL